MKETEVTEEAGEGKKTDLIQLSELCILILDWRPRAVVQCRGDEERGHVKSEQLVLLRHAEGGVDGEEVEVLGEVAAVLRHLAPQQGQHR